MSKIALVIGVAAVLLMSAPAFAVDGVVLINQSTVTAAGGFPFKITQPGSYKLSGNLVVTAQNTDGIDILASNVTLDLNGFSIAGPVTCSGAGSGLSCNSNSSVGISGNGQNNLTIRNGSVGGFGAGVVTFSPAGVGLGQLVEEIHASGNSDVGISVANGIVRRNSASANGIGISALSSVTTENVATSNKFVDLVMSGGVFGSNALGSVANNGAVSQNNNDCGGSSC